MKIVNYKNYPEVAEFVRKVRVEPRETHLVLPQGRPDFFTLFFEDLTVDWCRAIVNRGGLVLVSPKGAVWQTESPYISVVFWVSGRGGMCGSEFIL